MISGIIWQKSKLLIHDKNSYVNHANKWRIGMI